MTLTDSITIGSLILNGVIMLLQTQLKTAVAQMKVDLAQLELRIRNQYVTREDVPNLVPIRRRHENP